MNRSLFHLLVRLLSIIDRTAFLYQRHIERNSSDEDARLYLLITQANLEEHLFLDFSIHWNYIVVFGCPHDDVDL